MPTGLCKFNGPVPPVTWAPNDSIRIEIFRRFRDRFEVLMLFVDEQEQRAGIDILREMGLELGD